MQMGGFNASQLSSNMNQTGTVNNLSVANDSYKFGPRCQTSSNLAQTMNNNVITRSLARPRNMRLVDNAEERIRKRYDDNKFLDTEPNADVNSTWN